MADKALEEKIKPVVEEAVHKFLGVHIQELETDISDKIKKSPLLEFHVNTTIKYKDAKKAFKRSYIHKLLKTHFGNVAEVSRILHVDRRTIHRLIKELNISITQFRKELHRPEYFRIEAVKSIIQTSLDSYKTIIHPKKMKSLYAQASDLSKNIAKELPEQPMTLKQAEKEFDKKYLSTVLEEMDGNISQTAKRIGLRFETLHRKLKSLGITKK